MRKSEKAHEGPLFTIVTVAYNAEKGIERTICSVAEQRFESVEYIVIDGGSTDATLDIIKRHEADIDLWISEKDRGIYDGMNKGIMRASGRYLLFLNADDTLVDEGVLFRLAQSLEAGEDPDVVYGKWRLETEHGTYPGAPLDIAQLPRRWCLCHQATWVKTELLRQHPFDLTYKYVGDFEQISSLYIAGYKFKYVDVEIALLPIHSGTTYDHFEASTREHYAVLKKRGLCGRFDLQWMLLRKRVVRGMKRILPEACSNAFFAFLAKYYKVM